MLKKIKLLMKSILYYIIFKVKFGKRIGIHLINSIRGKLNIELFDGAKINIGKFLMTRGPLYLKCTKDAYVKIGEECFFNNNCSITAAEKIIIGNQCKFANNLVIIDHDHAIEQGHATAELITKPIIIEDNVWVGANCTILKGIHIGKGSVVAAGSVVTKNVPSYSIVAGVPAKIIKEIDTTSGESVYE